MTPIAPTVRSPRLLLVLGTLLALVVAVLVASPAAAQFVAEGSDAEAVEEPTDDEPAPVGGVDAGLGGVADADAGLGAPHATAAGLVALALVGHAANARRTVRD